MPQKTIPEVDSNMNSNCSILQNFIGNYEVQRLNDWCVLDNDSDAIVVGWYDSVFEGIDMWYPDEQICSQPRLFYY
jgi:hypothetical protein